MPEMAALILSKLQYLKDEFPESHIEIVGCWSDAREIIFRDPAPNVVFVDLTLPDSTMANTIAQLDSVAERTTIVVVTGAPDGERKQLVDRGFEVLPKDGKSLEGDGLIRACYRALTSHSRKVIYDDLHRNFILAERLAEKYAPRTTP